MEEQVFGADIQRTEMYLPNSKVDCSNLFGEYYAYYCCMDLCLEPKATCPLNDKPLLHDSCRGQFPDRLYTVANSSYITFVRRDGQDYFHENYTSSVIMEGVYLTGKFVILLIIVVI